jgi:hypothetical protein
MSFRVELEFLDGLFDIPPKQSRLSELAKSIVLFLRAVHLTTILQSIPFRNGLVDTASLLPKDGVFTLSLKVQPNLLMLTYFLLNKMHRGFATHPTLSFVHLECLLAIASSPKANFWIMTWNDIFASTSHLGSQTKFLAQSLASSNAHPTPMKVPDRKYEVNFSHHLGL